MRHYTSPQTMLAAIPSTVNCPLFALQAFTTGPGKASIAVYSLTRGQLIDATANIFIKHMANVQRHLQHSLDQLVPHPPQRRHHREHQSLNDYRKWCLLQQIKTRSKHPRQRHHHHHHHLQCIVIIIVVSGRL